MSSKKLTGALACLAFTAAVSSANTGTQALATAAANNPPTNISKIKPGFSSLNKRYIISFYDNKSLRVNKSIHQGKINSFEKFPVFSTVSKATKSGKSQFMPANAKALVESHGATVLRNLNSIHSTVAELNKDQLIALQNDPQVKLIEEDPERFVQAQQSPYGLAMIQADQMDESAIADMKVCIIDTGYDLGHPDLPSGSNITGEVSNTLTSPVNLGTWSDDTDGHGTHVAGIITALDNAVGSKGVSSSGDIKLHIVKVIHNPGWWRFYGSDMIAAVEACQLAGANVINMSLSGSKSSVAEKTAMDNAYANGLLLVGSAGNGGSTSYNYPASYDSVISVGAVNNNGERWNYSQTNDQLELTAPGVGIYSTIADGRYTTYDGTSAATPYVSGAAALVWSRNPDCSNVQIREFLQQGANDKGAAGRDNEFGFGIVRAKAAEDLAILDGCPVEQAPPQETIYDDPADFDEGEQFNVIVNDEGEIVLQEEPGAFDVIWVAASGRGTIVKINTLTGDILGEYQTAPNGVGRNPSRTTVDGNGSVWATNRNGSSVVHIGSSENNQCVDRNGNGKIDTSTGLGDIRSWSNSGNADSNGGVSTAADECIIHYVKVAASGTRHVAIDENNDIWVSGTGNRVFQLIDGETGQIKRTEGPVGYGGYGGLIDKNGVIWSAAPLLRWDTSKPLTGENGTNWTGWGHNSYGLCIDSSGNVWNVDSSGGVIRKFSPDGQLLGTYGYGFSHAQGCAIDKNDHVWVAHQLNRSTTVGHLDKFGNHVGNVSLGQTGPTGVAIDKNGFIWSTNYNSNSVSRIDPTKGATGIFGAKVGEVDMTIGLGGGATPYNYSDMTGSVQPSIPESGTINVIHDNGVDIPAGAGLQKTTLISSASDERDTVITWNETLPGNSTIVVTASSSTDGVNYGVIETVTNGAKLSIATDRYLRLSFTLTRASDEFDTNGLGLSPRLDNITITKVDIVQPAQ